ncbi:histidinol-phosphate transaminase [Rossellomorea vietnamensis]|uniref:Histidinol-phosphate transaminase n=1 Tax=Rossellomorea vietnamensis TaxID=218284 RepID=A0ACD4C1V0_9BACI|nr:histidinol-phosphate transaminase [Rossellomorea vietnamensis]UXH42530.1 histidinol-phosphate transaminase [Rossellomorea vietnamensis]
MALKFKTREAVTHIAPYVLGKTLLDLKKEHGLSSIRKLSENENIYGCSPKVKEWFKENGSDLFLYPDGAAVDLSQKVSAFLGVPKEQLVFGNGSDEVIRLLTRAYLSSGDEAIMADVTFPRYQTNVLLEGGTPVIVPLVAGTHDLQGMHDHITPRTKLIFVCNPNNPTGTIVGKRELLQFIESVPSHVLVVVDEAYMEYVTTDDYLETLPLLTAFENLIVLRTFSKIYGLAGLRVGFGVMNEEIAEQLRKVKDVFNVNTVAQKSAIIALEDQAFIRECTHKNEQGRHYLEGEFDRMGLSYFPSQSNFIMVDTGLNGDVVSHELVKEGLVVRSGTLLGYPDTVRVTVGTEEDNKRFVAALESILNNKGVK